MWRWWWWTHYFLNLDVFQSTLEEALAVAEVTLNSIPTGWGNGKWESDQVSSTRASAYVWNHWIIGSLLERHSLCNGKTSAASAADDDDMICMAYTHRRPYFRVCHPANKIKIRVVTIISVINLFNCRELLFMEEEEIE